MQKRSSDFVRRIIEEYRNSLKPPETEEVINQIFNRPLGFIAAKFFQKLGANPNIVTLISMIFGISSGVFFSRGKYPEILVGALLLEGWVILDCADGQLARMLNKSSQIGKTIDGLCDIAVHFSVFYGTAYALFIRTGAFYHFFLALAVHITFYLHIMLFDHFKNVFISVAKPMYSDKLDALHKLKEDVIKGKRSKDSSGFKLFITKLYYLFYRLESAVVSIGYKPNMNRFDEIVSNPEQIDYSTRELFYREMRGSVKVWSWIGDTIHITIFIVFGIANRLSFIFPMVLVGTNIWMLFALIYQRSKFKSLGISREMVMQERVD
ncbi:MAG: CDP-alcohol phosphatidyltransferase family protein [Spirochaetota bacterium]|nr:MAG: CDP-alcohol phosphatidyltransferase family protein [Spirochaetota bacterium]